MKGVAPKIHGILGLSFVFSPYPFIFFSTTTTKYEGNTRTLLVLRFITFQSKETQRIGGDENLLGTEDELNTLINAYY